MIPPRLLLLAATLLAVPCAVGSPQVIIEPAADRWMYPTNGTPGTRSQASTFSALPGAAGLDDRWAFFLFAFDTSAAIPAGVPQQYYRIHSAVVTSMIAQDNLFSYDPSYDAWRTYGTPTVPAALSDTDPGRPLELHGAGFRVPWTTSTFMENSSYGTSAPGTRNAYPLGFDAVGSARDVSSNITQQFETQPWAIGRTSEVTAGQLVPEGTIMNFSLDLGVPGVLGYLTSGLASGRVWFALSSLHPATQQAGEFVAYYTRDSFTHQFSKQTDPLYQGGIAPTLVLDAELSLPLSITRDGGQVTLAWPQFAGFTFTLQASPDLSPGSWQNIHQHSASAAGTGTFSEATAHGNRFYRIASIKTP